MTNVDVQGSELRIDGETVSFSNPVSKVLEFEECVVVLLKLTGEDFPDIHQNVIGIDYDGTIQWKIEKGPEEGYYDSYASIHNDDGDLWAYNLSGMSYKIDLEDGSIVDEEFVK